MALTRGDDFPIHQTAEPIANSGTDRNFYDRYFFNGYGREGEAYFAAAFGVYPHLNIAQQRMTDLARTYQNPSPLAERALKQAARELLLAQSSDWPFIMRTGTSPDYAKRRVKDHLLRFIALHEQLTSTSIDDHWLRNVEELDNIFPGIDYRYWG